MRLSVHHVTRNAYDMPVRAIVQSLRMYPVSTGGQTVLNWEVTIDGANFGTLFRDGAGDLIRTATLVGPLSSCDIVVEGEVETTNTFGVLTGHREIVAPATYLSDTPMTKRTDALRELAAKGQGDGALALAHDLSRLVSAEIAYVPGLTEHGTTAQEVLKLGQGVCQDMTHVLIALAQAQGLPARYVTGYLAAREGEPPHEASHAWAEIFVEGLGWVGFDPANACCPDERYIRMGSGRDADGAAPIRGSFRGKGTHQINLEVAVGQAAQ
jgi:transglutaminase-like putative cysteine protease